MRYIVLSITLLIVCMYVMIVGCNNKKNDPAMVGSWKESSVRHSNHPAKIMINEDHTFVFENFPNDIFLASQNDNVAFIKGPIRGIDVRTCKTGTDEEKWPTLEGTWEIRPPDKSFTDSYIIFTVTHSSFEEITLPYSLEALFTDVIFEGPRISFPWFAWSEPNYDLFFRK